MLFKKTLHNFAFCGIIYRVITVMEVNGMVLNLQQMQEIALAKGEKTVVIYFPWEACFELANVQIDEGASLTGLYRPRKLLCFGDSITQGVYSNHPSLSYACRLADLLDADLTNKGIGGDMVFPELVCEREANTPDLITVAYGTND